jgi:hypothetical protein
MTYDPEAEKRSLMMKQPVLCNGQQTGHPCKQYWAMVRNVASHNPDFLRQGEKLRFCRAWGYEPLEFGEGATELATYCTLYEADKNRRYDEQFEEYKALSEEEMEANQLGLFAKQTPADDKLYSLQTSTAVIANGVGTSTHNVSIDMVLSEESKND